MSTGLATGTFDLPTWASLSPDEQRAAMRSALSAGLDRDFDLDAESQVPAGWLTFALKHRATGLLFQLVPGGRFDHGFTEGEEQALREELESAGDPDAEAGLSHLDGLAAVARPVVTTRVPAFLLATAPLGEPEIASLIGQNPGGLLPQCVDSAGALALEAALQKHGLRLPSEAEHEHAYRAGTQTPFPWGVTRPKSPRVHRTPFGLERVAELAEVCADGWVPTLEGAPVDGSARSASAGPRVARGGSAAYWPWQGVGEWVQCLSAHRSAATDHTGFLRVRPARSLPA